MLYAVEPTLASELDRGAIVRGGCRNLRVTKVTTSDHRVHVTGFPHYDDIVTESHVIVYYTPRFKKTTTSTKCPNNEKFTRVIEVQE